MRMSFVFLLVCMCERNLHMFMYMSACVSFHVHMFMSICACVYVYVCDDICSSYFVQRIKLEIVNSYHGFDRGSD